MNLQEEYLRAFFSGLNNMNGDYAVIHSYESLPFSSVGDIDIAVNNITQHEIEGFMMALCKRLNWRITQRLWYDVPECFYYVLSNIDDHSVTLKIDLLFDKNAVGYTFYSTVFLTDKPLEHNDIKHSNQTAEFCYKLTKRIKKGYFDKSDPALLNSLFSMSDKNVVSDQLTRQYGNNHAQQLMHLFKSGHGFTGTLENWKNISSTQRMRYKYGSISRTLSRFKWQSQRVIHRLLHPCGAILQLPAVYSGRLDEIKEKLSDASIDSFRVIVTDINAGIFDQLRYLSASTLLITIHKDSPDIIYFRTSVPGKRYAITITAQSHNETEFIDAVDNLICNGLEERMSTRLYHHHE